MIDMIAIPTITSARVNADRRELLWCLAIGWCFVAPKTAWGKARRGSIAATLCDRGATKPQAVFSATLRAAVLFASRFVARSSQTAEGYARRSRLAGNENSLRRNTSQLRDTTPGALGNTFWFDRPSRRSSQWNRQVAGRRRFVEVQPDY